MGLAEISRFDHPVLQNYLVDDAYDETFESPGKPRPHYAPLLETFSSLPADEIRRRKHAADHRAVDGALAARLLGEIVKAEAGILENDTPEAAGEKLRRTVERLAEEGEVDRHQGQDAWRDEAEQSRREGQGEADLHQRTGSTVIGWAMIQRLRTV